MVLTNAKQHLTDDFQLLRGGSLVKTDLTALGRIDATHEVIETYERILREAMERQKEQILSVAPKSIVKSSEVEAWTEYVKDGNLREVERVFMALEALSEGMRPADAVDVIDKPQGLEGEDVEKLISEVATQVSRFAPDRRWGDSFESRLIEKWNIE